MRINEENYVAKAESVILKLSKQVDKQGKVVAMVTNSKIRNLLSMSADIYNQVLDCKEDKLPQELNGRIEYLRVRYIYEAGREPRVKHRQAVLDNIDESMQSNFRILAKFFQSDKSTLEQIGRAHV